MHNFEIFHVTELHSNKCFKIKTALLSDSGGRFVLGILNAMRIRESTTGSIEECLLLTE